MRNLFKAKVSIPLIVLLALVISIAVVNYYAVQHLNQEKKKAVKEALSKIDHVSQRLLPRERYKHIRPLLFVEYKREDTLLLKIKKDIMDFIKQKQDAGVIRNASAYLRLLNHHQDVRINPSEIYFPGSLMKVPMLISFLKEAESNPAYLDKSISFDAPFSNLPNQNIKGKNIEVGKSYSFRELLHYMIVYSDNNATALLGNNIDFEKLSRVFEDLALPPIIAGYQDYAISLKDYSRFFRCLYNASYLSWDMSEYALDLLSKCTYSNGLKRYLPDTIKVAYKFGERNLEGIQQLHEMGIVYLGEQTYLVGIMTKGKDVKALEDFIADVSKIIFDYFVKEGKSIDK
ncbi:MAG: serine hydrolase [Flavobacteriales bacterium]